MPIVQDIQQYQTTPEKEVFQDSFNFKGKAIDAATSLVKTLANRPKGTEKKNYANLYKYANDFKDVVDAKGLNESAYQEAYRNYTKLATDDSENYTPSEIATVQEEVFGKSAPKSIKAMLETEEDRKVSEADEYIAMASREMPTASTEEKRKYGLAMYSSDKLLSALEEITPDMTAEDRKNLLQNGAVRNALQTSIINLYQSHIKEIGGVPTPDDVAAFKNSVLETMQSKGFYGPGARSIIDNAMSMWEATAIKAAEDTSKASKYTKDAYDSVHNMNMMQLQSIPVVIDRVGKKLETNLGTVSVLSGVDPNNAYMLELAITNPNMLKSITTNAVKFQDLSDEEKSTFISRTGVAKMRLGTEEGSIARQRVDSFANKAAEDVYKAVTGMSREELLKNTSYNSAPRSYILSHDGLDKSKFTEQDYVAQEQQANAAFDATTKAWNILVKGNGMILFDSNGNPKYITLSMGDLYDSTNAGKVVEWLDNDAVDARDKAFATARKLISTAAQATGLSVAKITDMYNDYAIRNSDAMRAYAAYQKVSDDLKKSEGLESVAKGTLAPLSTIAMSKLDLTNADIENIKENVNNGNYRAVDIPTLDKKSSKNSKGILEIVQDIIVSKKEKPVTMADTTQEDFLLPVDGAKEKPAEVTQKD